MQNEMINISERTLENKLKPSIIFDDFINNRQQAEELFLQLQLPDVKEEDWKYSNIRPSIETFHPKPNHNNPSNINTENNTIKIHNGYVSSIQISEEIKKSLDIISQPLYHGIDELNDAKKNIFIASNLAYFQTCLQFVFKKNSICSAPLNILFSWDNQNDLVAHTRFYFIAEENSQASVIIKHNSNKSNASVLHNHISKVSVKDSAKISFSRLQQESNQLLCIDHVIADVFSNGFLSWDNVLLSGKLMRNTYQVSLKGEHANATLSGIAMLNESCQGDTSVLVNHLSPHCESNQKFKSLIDDNAQSVFTGKIFVHQKAQKTNAYQSSKNIVLSESAKSYTRPQLEIYADDVKCSHGATTGQLDEDALYYLRSRGISEINARKLLLMAFVEDVLNQFENKEFKMQMEDVLHNKWNA
jgi:Fe-S cluster assembly protein SufD